MRDYEAISSTHPEALRIDANQSFFF